MPRHSAARSSIVIYSEYARPPSFPGILAQYCAGVFDRSCTGTNPSLLMAAATSCPSTEKTLK